MGQVVEVMSFVLALYFLFIEAIATIRLVKSEGWKQWETVVETVVNELSPILILTCQAIILVYQPKLDDPEWFWFWELVAWTGFVLWMRLGVMLRMFKSLSAVIEMILQSFKVMVPYLIIAIMGVMAFTNAFFAVRQTIYIKLEG